MAFSSLMSIHRRKHSIAFSVHGVAAFFLAALLSGQTYAAWFEAKGQALIINDNRVKAREQATKEALKQALLFSGASVQSVQTLANGLLSSEQTTITASGDVHTVELIDEVWHDGYVSVTLRADIFPKAMACEAAEFRKTIATTYYPIETPQQAQDGQLHKMSAVLPRYLQRHFTEQSATVSVDAIAPYSARWQQQDVLSQAPALARQRRVQYVIAATITDLSVYRPASSALTFWQDNQATRQFSLALSLLDGMHGGVLLNKEYSFNAPWEFDRFSQLDVTSEQFWQSAYGQSLDNVLTDIVTDVSDKLACQPATGRVLQVKGEQLQVSLGRAHGLKVGDELQLYQTQQVSGPFGETFMQYNLYPHTVTVTAAYADSATVSVTGDGLLMNIQPNDFVAKR
ncbi:flagella assembly protein FlgT [Salinimonas lutimaris]|uniref:flagella assembly protein FlgT n=1 Tax=Salinimonas lutimaris TaxID=914153 RepID=UPI0010C0350A|nr:flagella assembly protein FlgT [Salinimonas lutimaris]